MKVINARRGKLRLAHGVILQPGLNEVPPDLWARCEGHPLTQHYVQRRDVLVPPGPPPVEADPIGTVAPKTAPPADPTTGDTGQAPTPVAPPARPDELKAKEAISVIQACRDANLLRELLSVESRFTVVRAIEKRILDLEG